MGSAELISPNYPASKRKTEIHSDCYSLELTIILERDRGAIRDGTQHKFFGCENYLTLQDPVVTPGLTFKLTHLCFPRVMKVFFRRKETTFSRRVVRLQCPLIKTFVALVHTTYCGAPLTQAFAAHIEEGAPDIVTHR